MKWTREKHTTEIPGGTLEFFAYRATTSRHGQRAIALVVAPTADGRWQARSGPYDVDTMTIATDGDWHGTEPTAGRAKRAVAGWAGGV